MRGFFHSRALAWALTLSLLLGSGGASSATETLRGEAPVDLSADALTYDQASATYRASGAVRMQKGGVTLLADELLYRARTGEAQAVGDIHLSDPETTIEADRVELDLESGRGRLVNGRILLREHQFRVSGDLIERFGERDYRIEGGTFTTCEGEVPSWKFGARRLDVTVGGYARARHAVFYLRDIPVFYSPYFFYPVKTERESGFLMPRFGTSNRRGTQLSLAWYQVIARNQDATFHLDYLSRLGLGKGLEYRYIFGAQDAGELNLYHVGGFSDQRDYSALDWRHAGQLPGDVRLSADVEWVSHRDYFETFGEVAGEYNREETDSVIALSKRWRYFNLGGQFKYTKNLAADSDETLQRLPEVVLHALRRPIGKSPFFFAFESSFTRFWRDEGVTGERLTLRPELSATFHPGEFLEVRPAVGYRERLYRSNEDGGLERLGIFDFSTRVSTRFSRVYDVGGGKVRKVRHSLQPEILYTYVPQRDQSRLPQFDTLDEIEAEHRIGYALVNRLIAQIDSPSAPLYHEFLYLRLSQSYDIRESRGDDLILPDQRREPFSDVRAELIARPNNWSTLEAETRFDVESGDDLLDRFFLLHLGGRVWSPSGNALSLSYRYQQDYVNYLAGGLDVAWLKPLYLSYQHRHDFDSGRTLEKIFNVEYRAQCWSLYLTLRDRPLDTEYLISFALTGLGRVTGLGGRFGPTTP